jgi:hypothetical protein
LSRLFDIRVTFLVNATTFTIIIIYNNRHTSLSHFVLLFTRTRTSSPLDYNIFESPTQFRKVVVTLNRVQTSHRQKKLIIIIIIIIIIMKVINRPSYIVRHVISTLRRNITFYFSEGLKTTI